MPRIQPLARLTTEGGYFPSEAGGSSSARPNTIYRGYNYWLLPGGRAQRVRATTQDLPGSASVGPKLYAIDQYRGAIGGALVSSRLPKESLVRYQGSALFFLSENTSQQVYINEFTTTGAGGPYTLTGVTTSATAGKLRVALLSGTTYTAYDAGIAPPPSIGTVAIEAGGSKSMDGIVSIRASARRITTDTTSNPTEANVQTLAAAGSNRIRVTLPALGSGTDGWIYSGTGWGLGNFGPWKVVREVRSVITGTVATDGTTAIVGTDTRFLRDLRPGDLVTINASNYTIATVTSDTTATTSGAVAGTASGLSVTMVEIVLDWRNNELGEPIEFDNDPPPLMDGVLNFNNVLFGWKDNTFYAAKIGNPEGWPAALARVTQSGGNIVGALAGDTRIYLLTTNSLEVVTFTQNPDDPFIIRQAWAYGFSSPAQATMVDGILYAVVGTSLGARAIRTRVDDAPDMVFGAAVELDMTGWNTSRVVMAHDPVRAAVLFCYYDTASSGQQYILPFLLQQQYWSVPHTLPVSRQITGAAVVSNQCYFSVLVSAAQKVYGFENDTNSSVAPAYLVWPFISTGAFRALIKRVKVTGFASALRIYATAPGSTLPDVTNSGAMASGPYTLSSAYQHEAVVQTNQPNCQSFAIRLDSSGLAASEIITECGVFGVINETWR